MLWMVSQSRIEERPRGEGIRVPRRKIDIRKTEKRKCIMYSIITQTYTLGMHLSV